MLNASLNPRVLPHTPNISLLYSALPSPRHRRLRPCQHDSRRRCLRPSAPSLCLPASQVPKTIDPISRPVLMAALNEYDILGIPIPKSRRMYALEMTSE